MDIETPARIAALKAEADRLAVLAKDAATAARDAKEIYNAARCAAHPFQSGDIIKHPDGSLAKVTHLTVDWLDGIMVIAVMQKKDGTFGRRTTPQYDDGWRGAVLHKKAGE